MGHYSYEAEVDRPTLDIRNVVRDSGCQFTTIKMYQEKMRRLRMVCTIFGTQAVIKSLAFIVITEGWIVRIAFRLRSQTELGASLGNTLT